MDEYIILLSSVIGTSHVARIVVMYQQGVPRVYDSHVEQRECSKINSTLHNNTLDLSRARRVMGTDQFFAYPPQILSLKSTTLKNWCGLHVREKQCIYF